MPATEDIWPDDQMLEAAMGLIANSSGGDWSKESLEWQEAARKWIDAYGRKLSNPASIQHRNVFEQTE